MKPSTILKKAYDYITDKNYRVIFNAHRGFYNRMDDRKYIELMYSALMHKELNLDNPQSFNEKLQWLKLYDRRPEYTTMVDKYTAKNYASGIIGKEYIIPTLGVWNHFDEIDFDKLPSQFVLKCTHDSGGLVICRDKRSFDKEKAGKQIEKCLKYNYYYLFREWPYKDVKPRIIAEKYLEDTSNCDLRDYKFMCFNGTVKCLRVNFEKGKNQRTNYYSADGGLMAVADKMYPPDFERKIALPDNFKRMKELACMLSNGIPFLRADFYSVEDKIYFGEMTLYPEGGFGEFLYEGNDELLGSWLKLPSKPEVL